MGASASTCCGTQEAPETEIDLSPAVPRIAKSPREPLEIKNTNEKTSTEDEADSTDDGMEAFMQHLEGGLSVFIILQDKSRLKCKVSLFAATKIVILTCGPKERKIPLSDIKAVLHTTDQLSRVENAAGIGANEPCAAIHLSTGNCIPLFFVSEDDKRRFVRAIGVAKRPHEQEPN